MAEEQRVTAGPITGPPSEDFLKGTAGNNSVVALDGHDIAEAGATDDRVESDSGSGDPETTVKLLDPSPALPQPV